MGHSLQHGWQLETMFKGLSRKRMQGVINLFEERRASGHEGILKASEVYTITHFLGEDVGWITSSADDSRVQFSLCLM